MSGTVTATAASVRSGAGLYLTSYGLTLLGGGMASVVLPLLVLDRTGDVLAAGLLASASTATSAAVGMFGGLIADRLDRRLVSAASALAAAASTAALPIVDAVRGLDMTTFLVLGVLAALIRVPGTTAHEALLPATARLRAEVHGGDASSLDRLVAIRESLSNVLLLAGPGLGGLLVGVAGPSPSLLLATSGTGLLAAMTTFAIDPRAGRVVGAGTAADGRGALRRAAGELSAGWRFLARSRVVLAATMVTAVFAAAISSLQTTLMPAYFTAEQLPGLTGLTLSAFAAGSLVGSALYAASAGRTARGPRRRTWFVVGMVGSLVGFGALGTLASPWVVLGAAALVGLTNAPSGAVLGVLTVEATPDALRGRVLGAQNALLMGAPALVAAPLGLVAAAAGLPVAAAAVTLLTGTTAVLALLAPSLRTLERGPTEVASAAAGPALRWPGRRSRRTCGPVAPRPGSAAARSR